MRMGFAHGWVTAKTFKEEMPWDNEAEWRRAGGRLHNLQGHVIVDVPKKAPEGEGEDLFAWSLWKQSYEAEQHIQHLGRADECVCWALTGFASGYMSYANDREVIALEQKCVGKGDAVCLVVAKFKENWGKEIETTLSLLESKNLERGLEVAVEALKQREAALHRASTSSPNSTEQEPDGMVARSKPMLQVLDLARRVARVDSVVLVTGESGAGKERIAQLVHRESARLKGPFIAVNCGAVTESLLESELFGHVRGAFTGATSDRAGFFEAAQGGTLFLDEIGELPRAMQVKLLRVLQEREVRRVGENRGRAIDVRLIAATNRDLMKEVELGNFRKDLYYRLKVIEIRIPPLGERKADILPLARFFLQRMSERMQRQDLTGFEPEAVDRLLRHPWPGNVRELENAIEYATVLARPGKVTLADLPEDIREERRESASTPGKTLEDMECEHIETVLRANHGNRTHAAAQLGIGVATLFRKLKKYQLDI
jgi:transcriptional regulator with PAS, ATPase and Fis domain